MANGIIQNNNYIISKNLGDITTHVSLNFSYLPNLGLAYYKVQADGTTPANGIYTKNHPTGITAAGVNCAYRTSKDNSVIIYNTYIQYRVDNAAPWELITAWFPARGTIST